MIELNRNLTLPYSPGQLYALVGDIEKYPEFLPYCQAVNVHKRQGAQVEATVVVGYKGLQYRFTTRNQHVVDREIVMELITGPFKTLKGNWQFIANEQGCGVELQLQAEFKNKLLSMILKNKLNYFVDQFVDAFVARARKLYD